MITIQNYKGLKAEQKNRKCVEADIMEEISTIQQGQKKTVEVERAAVEGDTVLIDYAGFCEGNQFEGGTAEKFPLQLGSGMFIPGFEEQLIGASAGDEVDVNVTFPEQYEPSLAGKPALFKCKVHKVSEEQLPELNDEFAKKVSSLDSMKALKAYVEEQLQLHFDRQAKADVIDELMDKIMEENPFEIAEEEIKKESDGIIKAFIYNMTGQEMEAEDFCRRAGTTMKEMYSSFADMADKNVRRRLVATAIADQENIIITDADLEEQFKELSKQYNMEISKVKELLDIESYTYDLRMLKAYDLIYDMAEITIVEDVPTVPAE